MYFSKNAVPISETSDKTSTSIALKIIFSFNDNLATETQVMLSIPESPKTVPTLPGFVRISLGLKVSLVPISKALLHIVYI